jgi:hypothetical protein
MAKLKKIDKYGIYVSNSDERPRIQIELSIRNHYFTQCVEILKQYNVVYEVRNIDDDKSDKRIAVIATAGEFYEIGRKIGSLIN